jgi:UDP-N-acetylmuramyl tripeptide synthase
LEIFYKDVVAMRITSLKVYEGNNIKRRKRIICIILESTSDSEVKKYLKAYFRVSFLLGFKEQLVDIDREEGLIRLWVTYTQEEISKYLLNNIMYNLDNAERLAEKAGNLIKEGFVYDIAAAAREKGMLVIDINEDLFQIGYGKNSTIIGRSYQSYENMVKVFVSRNRKSLWQYLRYAQIPKVLGKVLYSIEEIKDLKDFKYPLNLRSIDKTMDIKITISDEEELNRVLSNMMNMYTRAFVYSGNVKYRVICFRGNVGLLLKKEDSYRVIEIKEKSLEALDLAEALEKLKVFCNKVYKSMQIEFMYIDLQEEEELKAVDLGCVFDIAEELREVKGKVIDYFLSCLDKENIGLIPIISITGTNGKTTTSRLINYILIKLGFKSALTSTGGIFIDGRKIKNGDTTGFLSARDVLTNVEVETAVMETARGGMLKNGLGYEKARAAIITSISEDHIGMHGIKDIKDLANIKTIVLDELDCDGKIIVKAQCELMEYVRGRKNLCLYEIEKNDYIAEHVASGGEAYYLEGDYIVACRNKAERKLLDVKAIPFTHGGISKGNIKNIMCAIAAVSTICSDEEAIINALTALQCDLYFNPGRQNLLDFEKFKVILDYGHNAEAFHEVLSIGKSLKTSRLTGIVAAAGDRLDKYIRELGYISAKYCDSIIIREQADLRERAVGESAGLIRQGALEAGFKEENLKIIYKEEDAILYAMENAEAGEVIVLFTQCLDVIIPAINSFLEKQGKPLIGEGVDLSH